GSGSSALSRVNAEAAVKVALRGDRILISPPRARADADHVGEHPRKMALVGKAAGQRHVRKPSRRIAQDALCLIDAARQQPSMRREPVGPPKGRAKMPDQKAKTAPRVAHGRVAGNIAAKGALAPLDLPGPRPAAPGPSGWLHPAISLRDVDGDGH